MTATNNLKPVTNSSTADPQHSLLRTRCTIDGCDPDAVKDAFVSLIQTISVAVPSFSCYLDCADIWFDSENPDQKVVEFASSRADTLQLVPPEGGLLTLSATKMKPLTISNIELSCILPTEECEKAANQFRKIGILFVWVTDTEIY
jgi:hypothetical protein